MFPCADFNTNPGKASKVEGGETATGHGSGDHGQVPCCSFMFRCVSSVRLSQEDDERIPAMFFEIMSLDSCDDDQEAGVNYQYCSASIQAKSVKINLDCPSLLTGKPDTQH